MYQNVTANGNFKLQPDSPGLQHTKGRVYISGTIGTATLSITHKDAGGAYKALTGLTPTVDNDYLIEHGDMKAIYLTVSGVTTGTDLHIEYAGIR